MVIGGGRLDHDKYQHEIEVMLNVKFFLVVVVKVSIFFVARLHSSSFETFVVYDDDDPRQSMNKKEEETSPDFFRVLHFQFIHIRDRRIVKRIFF